MVKSPLYPHSPRRVKRTHIANQMTRVQRANGSLAQVWGRAAPNGLPAENMARPICLRKNAPTPRHRLRSPAFRVPSSPRSPSGSPPENVQSRSEPTECDNRMAFENALLAIPTHGGIGTKHSASRSVWRCASNSRREQTQDISTETYDRREQTQDILIERQGPVRASDGPSTSYTIRKGTPAANGRLSFYIGFVRAVRSSVRRGNGFCALWRA